jgi:hypothetical protein
MTLACRTHIADFDHLSLRDVAEYEALDQHLQAHGRLPYRKAPRYAWLVQRRYWPPVVSDADKGAA